MARWKFLVIRSLAKILKLILTVLCTMLYAGSCKPIRGNKARRNLRQLISIFLDTLKESARGWRR